MNAYTLGQTLLLDPDLEFHRITEVLEGLGWRRTDPGLAEPPLVPNEPELATWTRGGIDAGGKPYCVYSFNPVARLRVLDLATVPPPLRAQIAEQLPLLDVDELLRRLALADPRERMLGLWGIQELERLDLVEVVAGLRSDPEPLVAQLAAEVLGRLEEVVQGRLGALGSLGLIADSGRPVIERLGDPDFTATLRPTAEDCEALFDPAAAARISAALPEIYKHPPSAAPGERYPRLEVQAAMAGLLRWPNELSDRFPRGYRDIAGWMEPNRVWLTWALGTGPGVDPGGVVRYDGLAWLEGRWVWIPKPFRVLAPLLLDLTRPNRRVLH